MNVISLAEKRAAKRDALLIEAEARGCSAYLLIPRRDLATALAAYVRDTREGEQARLTLAFKHYNAMPHARRVVVLASI